MVQIVATGAKDFFDEQSERISLILAALVVLASLTRTKEIRVDIVDSGNAFWQECVEKQYKTNEIELAANG